MKRLTAKQWQALPAHDKEVLKTLGLTEFLAPKISTKCISLPEPYILHRISHCSLCQTTSEEYSYMFPSPVNPTCLQSRSTCKEDIPLSSSIQKEEWTVPTCKYCFKALQREPKEALILKLILSTTKERR